MNIWQCWSRVLLFVNLNDWLNWTSHNVEAECYFLQNLMIGLIEHLTMLKQHATFCKSLADCITLGFCMGIFIWWNQQNRSLKHQDMNRMQGIFFFSETRVIKNNPRNRDFQKFTIANSALLTQLQGRYMNKAPILKYGNYSFVSNDV